MSRTLRIASSSTSACHIGIRRGGLRIATSVVVLLLSVGFVSVAQLIVGTLQVGGRITLCSGSVSLFDERPGPSHLF
jgi:hypothetical protein